MRQVIRPDASGNFPNVIAFNESFFGQVALGNGTQLKVFATVKDGWHVIAVLGFGAYQFEGYVHRDYVSEKLGIKNKADAANLADFINAQTTTYRPRQIQGAYSAEFCEDLAPRYP